MGLDSRLEIIVDMSLNPDNRSEGWGSKSRDYNSVEEFDKDTKVKEKGRTSVNFRDKDLNSSQNSEQPCQVHQN